MMHNQDAHWVMQCGVWGGTENQAGILARPLVEFLASLGLISLSILLIRVPGRSNETMFANPAGKLVQDGVSSS